MRGVAPLKLLDSGISRDTLATIGLFSFPLQLVIPWVLDRWLTGRRPLTAFLLVFVVRYVHLVKGPMAPPLRFG